MVTRINRRNLHQAAARSKIILCLAVFLLASFEGFAQQTDQSIASLQTAAKQGSATAQHKLGLAYFRGEGITQNKDIGVKWIERAAIQGFAPAQNDIGAFYHSGQGVPQDFRKAAVYYGLAAQQGQGFAALNMGGLYFNGQGVPQDSAQAAYWFTIASQSDDATAARQGKIWSERLKERARHTLAKQQEQERNSTRQTQSELDKGITAGLIFLAIAFALSGGDGGGGAAPSSGQQSFEPYDICSGFGAMMEACGG